MIDKVTLYILENKYSIHIEGGISLSKTFKTISFSASKEDYERIQSLQSKYKEKYKIPINQSDLMRLLIEDADSKDKFIEIEYTDSDDEISEEERLLQLILNA